MQQATAIDQRIKSLEKEIEALKSLQKNVGKKDKKTSKKSQAKKLDIEGMLKGVKASEKDFKDAKKSLFPYDYK